MPRPPALMRSRERRTLCAVLSQCMVMFSEIAVSQPSPWWVHLLKRIHRFSSGTTKVAVIGVPWLISLR